MASRPPLTQADVNRLPLDKIIKVGGINIHTGWFGGISYLFHDARYGFARDNSGEAYTVDFDGFNYNVFLTRTGYYPGNYLEYQYNTANAGSVTVPKFCNELVTGGWKFFSSRGLEDIYEGAVVPMVAEDLLKNPYDDNNYYDWAYYTIPAMQHYPFCAMTNTRRADGRYAVYYEEETTELATDLANTTGSGTLVFAIDGTGSFGGGSRAIDYMTAVLNRYVELAGSNTRLIVTKFSDDFSYVGDPYDGVVLGDYSAITSSTIAAASDRIVSFQTGNGGDTNETQLMGIYVGMQVVKNLPGPKAIVVYTDAASVCPMPSNLVAPPMRQRHRDDGLTTEARQEKGHGSSQQSSIRQGGRVYY